MSSPLKWRSRGSPGGGCLQGSCSPRSPEEWKPAPIPTLISDSSGPYGSRPPTQVRVQTEGPPAALHVFPVLLNSQSLLPHPHPQFRGKRPMLWAADLPGKWPTALLPLCTLTSFSLLQ